MLGIPALGIENGGLGFGPKVEEHWQDAAVDGTRAVMAAIGMLEHTRKYPLPKRQLIYRQSHRVNSSVGGFLRPRLGPEALGEPVQRGQLLGEIVSPYTFEVVEELRGSADGLLFYVGRHYPVTPAIGPSESPTPKTKGSAGSRTGRHNRERASLARRDRINGELVPRGEHRVVRVPVLTDLDSCEIALHVHAVVGREPGPVLAMHTGLHGSEWQTSEITRRVIESLDPAEMRGTLLAVPVGNPIALSSRTRNLRDESDSPDLNRSFGGEQTWLADQLAAALVEHLISKADALVDFHCGLWGAAMGSVTCGKDFSDPSVSARRSSWPAPSGTRSFDGPTLSAASPGRRARSATPASGSASPAWLPRSAGPVSTRSSRSAGTRRTCAGCAVCCSTLASWRGSHPTPSERSSSGGLCGPIRATAG